MRRARRWRTTPGRPAARLAADAGFYRRLPELEFAMSLRLVLAGGLSDAGNGMPLCGTMSGAGVT